MHGVSSVFRRVPSPLRTLTEVGRGREESLKKKKVIFDVLNIKGDVFFSPEMDRVKCAFNCTELGREREMFYVYMFVRNAFF